ncbi:CsbD family protein [Streptomyces sp. NBC_01465]|uniref:CsbD family protein n=1 Tax=Streptomyces sp. NBC_01465 TaxID=2903878 RepID=UPI002E30D816|nr:CsbD family protein [Streptomyces sp. NBC_01465]
MGDDNGTFDQLKGKAKEAVGKATGDDRMAGEGKTDQVKGKAKNLVESAKDTLAGAKDSLTGDKKKD